MSFNPFDLTQLMFNCTDPTGAFTGGANCILDKSVEMLGDVFGTPAVASIPNYGMASNAPTFVSLFSMMVAYFDWASVGLIGLIFAYIVIMGTINTAHEGVAFGRQHNSTYTLIRAILGPVLMFPVPMLSNAQLVTSVSTLQAIILHLVLIGVNMANIVWSNTVAAAMYMPPSQLPGPVQSMIAQQVAKLYVYQAAFNAMGITLSDPGSIQAGNGTEVGSSDAVLYGQLMNEFKDYCGFASSTVVTNPIPGVTTSNSPYSQCIAALAKLQSTNGTGVIYPLSVGPDIGNGPGSAFTASSFTNINPAAGSNFFWPTYAQYAQFKFSFGTNAPFFDNGLFNLSGIGFQLTPPSSVAAAIGAGTSNPFPDDGCPANSDGSALSANQILTCVVNEKIIPNTTITAPVAGNLFSTVSSLAPATGTTTPPTIAAVDCSFNKTRTTPDGVTSNVASLCDMSPAVNDMTQSLISSAAAIAAAQTNQTDVPGTGASCIPDPTIAAVPSTELKNPTDPGIVLPLTVPQEISDFCTEPANSTKQYYGSGSPSNQFAGCFGTTPGIGNGQDALCVNKVTVYNTTGKQTLYYPIAAQDYKNSWWYGSEVYLSITQRLADNIKTIADDVNQFAISDSSLQMNGGGGTKTTTVNALELDRYNAGHSVNTVFNLASPSHTGFGMTLKVYTDPVAFYTNNYIGLGTSGDGVTPNPGTGMTAGVPLTFCLTGGSTSCPSADSNLTLATTAIVTPTWDSIVCLFNPTATTFLNQFINGNGGDNTCYSSQNTVKGFIAQPANVGTTGANGIAEGPLGVQIFQELPNVPVEYQTPLTLMIMWELQDNFAKNYTTFKDQSLSIQGLEQNIYNMITVLKLNHVYPSSSQNGDGGIGILSETAPANQILNQMFSKVLGANTPGSMTSSVSQNIGGVMSDIYSIGNQQVQDNTGTGTGDASVMESSYNNIAQVQQVGIEMINVVITSMQSVYQSIQDKANSYINKDQTYMIATASAAAGATALTTGASFIPGAAANAQVAAAVIQIGIMATNNYLQFDIVHQSYEMANLLMWLPLIIMVSTALFTAGVSFALIIPIMPFILFWSGQISWILSVMEAVIAAPLLCLAWAVPGGHTHMGHTLSGVKVLIGVVFRPVLMVLGLFSALILTFILIKFSSQAFQIVSSQILGFAESMGAQEPTYWQGSSIIYENTASMTTGVLAVLMLLLFCSLMVMAFNKCFSMIYMIPEKVLGWIGIQVQGTGAQDAEKLSGGVTQSAGQGAQAAGSTASQGAQAQSSHASQSASADTQASGAAASTSKEFGSAASKKPETKEPAKKAD